MKRILGIWDLNKAEKGLGSFLIFHQELLLLSEIHHVNRVDIVIKAPKPLQPNSLLPTISRINPKLQRVILETSDSKAFDFSDAIIWPPPPDASCSPCSYQESTLALQYLWRRTCRFLAMRGQPPIENRAKSWMEEHVGSCVPVVVHLKNNSKDPQSNANQTAWSCFFRECAHEFFRFIIIGNDQLDEDLFHMPNVLRTQAFGLDFTVELALIAQARLFMGMSSGPCNIALFSQLPYLIWKHPGHHTDIMRREFGGMDRFPFSTENQNFFLDWDSIENVSSSFRHTMRILGMP